MKLYDRILQDMPNWSLANWYDGLSPQDRHDTDMAIGYGRDDDWQRLATAQGMSQVRNDVQKAVVFDVSNVASYVASYGFDPAAIPAWNPPYKWSWWETSKVVARETFGYEQVGALVYTRETKQRVPEGDDDYPYEYGFSSRWDIFGYSRSHGVRADLTVPFQGIEMLMDKNGRLEYGHSDTGADSYMQYLDREHHLLPLIEPMLMAVGFSHCKNVSVVDAPRPPEKVAVKQERKIGRPLTQFKMLAIDPSMSQASMTGGAISKGPSSKRLHIARGNFAHYSEDKPLFGKYTGTFWRPAHVRGNADNGTVYKDYKVKP